MSASNNKQDLFDILRIVAIYASFGSLWIYLSDSALGLLVRDPELLTRFAIFKGLLFIVLTSTLLYVLITRLVGERQRAVAALQSSEQRFRSYVENANDITFSLTPAGVFSYVSPNWKDAFGYELAEVIGQPFPPFVHPDDIAGCMAFLQLVLATGQKQGGVEYRVLRKDGSYVWYAANGSLMYEPDGKTATFVGIGRDICERKRSDELLRLSEEKFATIFRASPDAVTLTRISDGTYLDVNQGFCDISGYQPEESIGNSVIQQSIWVDPQERDRLIQDITQHGYINNLEARFLRKDGTILTGQVSARMITLNHEACILGITRDISEHENRQKERLKLQKLESLGLLAGGIAHDFNNILTGILGNISFARMFLDESHRAFKILLEAEKATQRASDLSDQLLTFAKGGQPIKKALSARQVLEASASLVLRGSNVKSVIELPDDLRAIEADEGQLNQACNNILINAAQAMPGGGTITIQADNFVLDSANPFSLPPGEYVRVTFSDTGCGISDEDQKKIFDPYFSTKSGGSGLGLASVHSIISKHGGHISVRSRAGLGTTFDLLLPASHVPAAKPEAEGDRRSVPGAVREGTTLLVMDDEETIRSLTSEMLAVLGYKVQTCINGEQAVALYSEAQQAGTPFAAVIMDLTVPGAMGGKEAAGRILQLDPDARLIVSSGYCNDPVMANYDRYGFSAMIVKPYHLVDMAQTLSRLLS